MKAAASAEDSLTAASIIRSSEGVEPDLRASRQSRRLPHRRAG
jgi:hypothetical protein